MGNQRSILCELVEKRPGQGRQERAAAPRLAAPRQGRAARTATGVCGRRQELPQVSAARVARHGSLWIPRTWSSACRLDQRPPGGGGGRSEAPFSRSRCRSRGGGAEEGRLCVGSVPGARLALKVRGREALTRVTAQQTDFAHKRQCQCLFLEFSFHFSSGSPPSCPCLENWFKTRSALSRRRQSPCRQVVGL